MDYVSFNVWREKKISGSQEQIYSANLNLKLHINCATHLEQVKQKWLEVKIIVQYEVGATWS